jgi:hypothetical protein
VRHWCHNTLTFTRQKTRNRKDKNNKNNANIFSSFIYEKYTLQRQNAENLKQKFPEKEYRGLSPNFRIHVSVSELYSLVSAAARATGSPPAVLLCYDYTQLLHLLRM